MPAQRCHRHCSLTPHGLHVLWISGPHRMARHKIEGAQHSVAPRLAGRMVSRSALPTCSARGQAESQGTKGAPGEGEADGQAHRVCTQVGLFTTWWPWCCHLTSGIWPYQIAGLDLGRKKEEAYLSGSQWAEGWFVQQTHYTPNDMPGTGHLNMKENADLCALQEAESRKTLDSYRP